MFEMQITHDKYSNCAQDVFLNILQYGKFNANLLLSTGWLFYYNRVNTDIFFGDAINIYSNEFFEVENALIRYYGIRINHIAKKDYKTVIYDDKKRKLPICIYMDSYYCPWQSGYGKLHNNHLIILLEVNKDNCICADPYVNKHRVSLSVPALIKGLVYLVELIDGGEDNIKSFDYVLNDSINNMKFNHVVENIKRFSKDIIEHMDKFNAEMDSAEIAFIPIVRKMMYISYGRMSYYSFLKSGSIDFVQKYENDIKEFETLAKKWSLVCSKLIRYGMVEEKVPLLMQISDLLFAIAEEEEKISNRLLIISRK